MPEPTAQDAIGWLGEFKERETESRFREASVDNARRLVLLVSVAVLSATVLLATNDLGMEILEMGLFTPRNIQGIVAITCCVLAWRARTWRGVYLAVWLLAIGIMITTTMIELSRPPDYLLHLAMDVLILLGIYIAVPSTRAQLLMAAGYSGVLLWMHFFIKSPDYAIADTTVPMTIFLANFIGLLMSAMYNRVKRQFFAQLESERAVRQSLEAANQSVAELSRLMPMCSVCKNVRDDEGYWLDVEKYMESISGQQVTHGICPGCAKEMYGEDIVGVAEGEHPPPPNSGL